MPECNVDIVLSRQSENFILGRISIDGYQIIIRRAIQFWPLVGNVAAQESGASRLIDASTLRLEITLHSVDAPDDGLARWQLYVGTYRLPMHIDKDEHGPVMVLGIRYRDFFPQLGLHPSLRAQNPLTFTFMNEGLNRAVSVTLYDWRPNNAAYDGLPADELDARRRCAERFVVKIDAYYLMPNTKPLPNPMVSTYSVDLRYLLDI